MMLCNVFAFAFFICGLVAFGRGSGDDFADMKHMMGKLFEENAILRREVESMKDQIEHEVQNVRHEMRNEVEAMNVRLEHVQEGNSTFEQTIYQVFV